MLFEIYSVHLNSFVSWMIVEEILLATLISLEKWECCFLNFEDFEQFKLDLIVFPAQGVYKTHI